MADNAELTPFEWEGLRKNDILDLPDQLFNSITVDNIGVKAQQPGQRLLQEFVPEISFFSHFPVIFDLIALPEVSLAAGSPSSR
ncbi:hypothetical protein N7535_008660 [Penicillium sp. DV-2018c]|nr:hypothetical protein N7535_008660 [Penicillium sp. DV-2018c]